MFTSLAELLFCLILCANKDFSQITHGALTDCTQTDA